MLRTFIVTFKDGSQIEREGLSAAAVFYAVQKWTDQEFTIKVKE